MTEPERERRPGSIERELRPDDLEDCARLGCEGPHTIHEPDTLDFAWRGVEAALPKGGQIEMEAVRSGRGWYYFLCGGTGHGQTDPPCVEIDGDDLRAALRALAQQLREAGR